MLRLVVLVAIFFMAFWFVYKRMKKSLFFWTDEITSNDKLEDRANKIKIEGDNLHEDLNEKEKQLKQEQNEINNLKKKGF